jgi:CIC family chloride channel protein
VRHAVEIMNKDILVLPAELGFDAFLSLPQHGGKMRHVVITRGKAILGVLRVNTALRRGLEGAFTGVTLGEVAQRNFTIAHEEDIMFDVISRMARKNSAMVIVVRGKGLPRISNVIGLITKEHIADSVEESIRPYAADAFSS